MKRTQLGTAAAAIAASGALGMALAQSATAVAPDPPICGGGGAFTLSNPATVNVPDGGPGGPGSADSHIDVAGQAGTVRDIDIVTNLFHQVNGEVEMDLIHTPPGGTPKTVRLVTSVINGRGGAVGFFGTRWDDSALAVVSAQDWGANGPKLNLVPEGAMAAFIGDNPNGRWTLRIRDTQAVDTGRLDGWTLDVKTTTVPPATTAVSFAGQPGVIPDASQVSLTAQVSGARRYITDLNLRTLIQHQFSPDVLLELTSPSGTKVVISRFRGAPNRFSLTTLWDDQSSVLLSTHPAFTAPEQTMVPEGALGAFIGEDPNGTWTLTATDATPADTGSVDSWSLDFTTTDRCEQPAPPVAPRPIGLPAPVCRKVNLTTTILGAKRGERGDVARIKVKVANKTRNARARAAKAVFKLPAGFTLAGKQKGITLKKGKVTAAFGVIAGGKAKTKTIKLKAKANAPFGLKVSSVAVTALCGSKAKGATIKLIVARG